MGSGHQVNPRINKSSPVRPPPEAKEGHQKHHQKLPRRPNFPNSQRRHVGSGMFTPRNQAMHATAQHSTILPGAGKSSPREKGGMRRGKASKQRRRGAKWRAVSGRDGQLGASDGAGRRWTRVDRDDRRPDPWTARLSLRRVSAAVHLLQRSPCRACLSICASAPAPTYALLLLPI